MFNFNSNKRKKNEGKKFDEMTKQMDHTGKFNPNLEIDPNLNQDLKEDELRSYIHPESLKVKSTIDLMESLKSWINNELHEHRMVIKSLDDLYDGTILQKFLEKMADIRIAMPEVTRNHAEQKKKLDLLLEAINEKLFVNLPSAEVKINKKWDVDSIHSKNLVAILHLLVSLAVYFHAPISIPEKVSLTVIVLKKENGKTKSRHVIEEITRDKDSMAKELTRTIQHGKQKDAFDTLFEKAIDKLEHVKQELVEFVNRHLAKLSLELTDVDRQLHDGVFLILLLGLLEGFYIPLYAFTMTPDNFESKVSNVKLVFSILNDLDIEVKDIRPEDLVNLDLKSTLRVLYAIYTKYKHVDGYVA